MTTQQPVAVFDIDGTIFRSSLLIELVERLIEKGIFPREARGAYEEEWRLWRERRGPYEDYINKVVEIFMKQIKGVSFEEMAHLAGDVIKERQLHVYRYTRDLVKELKKQGYFLLAISHSPKFIVDGFALEMGFDKSYGKLYTTDSSGCFTGEVEHEEVIMSKSATLLRAIHKDGLSLEGSVGVGDTESDIPMLEMVEKPIAFNPNQALYTQAKRRGWKVVVERKDVIYEL